MIFLACPFAQSTRAAYEQNGNNKDVQISLGALYSSDRIYRGAMVWPKAVYSPLVGVTLYNRISLNGPGVGVVYNGYFLTASVGFKFFDDHKPLFYLEDHEPDYRNTRPSSWDLYATASLRFMPGGSLSLHAAQGIKGYFGVYTSATLMLPILPFVSAGHRVGYGDTKANRYAYGPEAVAGLGHQDTIFKLTLPFLPGKGRLVTTYTMARIHKTPNKNADYVRGDDKSNSLTVFAMWSF